MSIDYARNIQLEHMIKTNFDSGNNFIAVNFHFARTLPCYIPLDGNVTIFNSLHHSLLSRKKFL